jgi:hypothetical protein
MLIKCIYILKLLFTIIFCDSRMGMHWAPYAYSFWFLWALFFLFFFSFFFFLFVVLKLPNFIYVSNSCSYLVLSLNKWVFIFKLYLRCNILILTLIEPWVINFLCFVHEWFNSIYWLIIDWLVFYCSLANCLIIQNVCFLIFLTFVNKYLAFIHFYL